MQPLLGVVQHISTPTWQSYIGKLSVSVPETVKIDFDLWLYVLWLEPGAFSSSFSCILYFAGCLSR